MATFRGVRVSSFLLATALAALVAAPGLAQVSITALGVPLAEDFNTLASSGTSSTLPTGWAFSESGTNANTTYAAGTGSGTAGDTYSFGAASDAERAFGGLLSGSLNPTIGAAFTNNTGQTIISLDIAYTGEMWRLGTAGRVDRIDFQYSLNATSLTTGTWTDVDGLDFVTPDTSGSAGARNGNVAPYRTDTSGSVGSLSIANGATFWIRWTDFNASGADDGLAVDDFSLTPQGESPVVTLSVDNVTGAEGDVGSTVFTFTVTLNLPAETGGVTFDIATEDGTAIEPDDYEERSLVGVTIPEGEQEYSFDVTVYGDAQGEPDETFLVNVSNVVGANVADDQGLGTITNDDPVAIHDIQGSGSSSAFAGHVVDSVTGVVTAVRYSGFFIQAPDADADADPLTSEGILVYTGSTPPAEAVVGNLVQVHGTVSEYIPSADPQQPPLTEIGGSLTVVVVSSGNPLPTPVALDAIFPDPVGAYDQLERVEGMLVSVALLTVVGPTIGNVNETTATATSTGVFFGVVTGVARPFREEGIQEPDTPPSGSIPPIPRFDTNPEVIRVDSDGLTGGSLLDVTAGVTITDLVGPLDYTYRRYTILPDPANPPSVSADLEPTPVTSPAAGEVTVASFNVRRLFDTVNDPLTSDPVLTPEAYDRRLGKVSDAVRNYLLFPDILGVQEVENLDVLEAVAARISADAVAASQPDPLYVAYLEEGNDVGGIDVGFLVKTAEVLPGVERITVNEVVQENAGETWIDPQSGSPELLNDRPPLRLDAVANLADASTFPLTVIVVHQRSLSGLTDETGGPPTNGYRVRAKRQAQAESLAYLIQGRQLVDPDEHIVVVGDFNAYEVNDGYVDVMDTVTGTPVPDDETVVPADGTDLVDPDLVNLYTTCAADDRYSYTYDGNAQSLDHALANAALLADLTAYRLEHPRINAGFPEVSTEETTAVRTSDHDPLVVYLEVYPDVLFADDFENGDTAGWSYTQP